VIIGIAVRTCEAADSARRVVGGGIARRGLLTAVEAGYLSPAEHRHVRRPIQKQAGEGAKLCVERAMRLRKCAGKVRLRDEGTRTIVHCPIRKVQDTSV
jgi:hypothetical protein